MDHMNHILNRSIKGKKHNWREEFKRLEGAYAPATLKSYKADIEIFEKWCIGQGLVPFPAN